MKEKKSSFKDTAQLIGRLGNITGFGLSLVMPIFLLVFGALWLEERFGVGDWIMAVAIVTGLITSGCTFYNFVSAEMKRAERADKAALDKRNQRRGRQDGVSQQEGRCLEKDRNHQQGGGNSEA